MLVHYYYHFRPWLLAVAGFCFFAMKTIVFDTTTTLTKVPTPTTHHDMLRCDLAKITFFLCCCFCNIKRHTDWSVATTSADVFLQAEK